MNWITSVATTNQWTVIWLAVGVVAFTVLYIWDIVAEDPINHGGGVGNPFPMAVVSIFGTFLLVGLFIGGGYLVDWVIWMWNN